MWLTCACVPWRPAVLLSTDPLVGLAACRFATLCGVELGTAPVRPKDFQTMERRVSFVPYGVQARNHFAPLLLWPMVTTLSCKDAQGLPNLSQENAPDVPKSPTDMLRHNGCEVQSLASVAAV